MMSQHEGVGPANDSRGPLFGLVEEVGVRGKAAHQQRLGRDKATSRTSIYLCPSLAYSHYLIVAIIYFNRRWQSVYSTSDTKHPSFKNSKW